VTVDNVEVEVGVGSPIPVHVIVSGNLPDVCSQVEYTEIKQDGSNFIISLFATPTLVVLLWMAVLRIPCPSKWASP